MLAGTAVGPGEGTELLGRIVGGGMDPDHLAVDGELDGGADDGHLDPAVAVRAADPVHGPGEAHIARVVGDASDRHASRGETGLAGGRCGGSWLLLLGLAGRKRWACEAASTPLWVISTTPSAQRTSTSSPASHLPTWYLKPPIEILPVGSTQRPTPRPAPARSFWPDLGRGRGSGAGSVNGAESLVFARRKRSMGATMPMP